MFPGYSGYQISTGTAQMMPVYEESNMCGIVGFTGNHQAAPILLDGLSKLEYRGYDSAGLAIRDGEKNVEVIKAKGRLKVLK